MGTVAKLLAAPFILAGSVRNEIDIAKERRLTLKDGAGWSHFFGRESVSGKHVTIDAALQLSTFWAAVRLTAQAGAGLPLGVYDKTDNGSRDAVDDEFAEIISENPNADQTSFEFWEAAIAWIICEGNAYAEIVKRGDRLLALQPIRADPFREQDGTLKYRVWDRGKSEEMPRDKVFHIKGFGQSFMNRDRGMSAVAAGVNSMGAALAADETAARMFANGMSVAGVLSANQGIDPDQRQQLQETMEAFVGSSRAGKMMVLEAGMTYSSVQLNPDDAQLLETRRFSVEEICRWVGVPPIIVGHAAQGQTMWGSGVEQILLSWLTLGIDPLCDRIERRIKKQLIRPTGKKGRYAEFNREALLQMDSAAKASFLSQMVQNGIMNRAEGRQKLNMPYIAGTETLTAQTNLAPLDKLGQEQATGSEQAKNAFMAWLGIGAKENEQASTSGR